MITNRMMRIIACLFLHTCVSGGILWSGIQFQYPETMYCQGCDATGLPLETYHEGKQRYFQSPLDLICFDYLLNVSSSQNIIKPNRLVQYFLEGLLDVKTPHAWIYYTFMRARLVYENIYEGPYTYIIQVAVNAIQSGNGCLRVEQYGDGFYNTGDINHLTTHEQEMHREGVYWESIGASGVRDLWATHYCNSSIHSDFVAGAEKRLHSTDVLSKTWKMKELSNRLNSRYIDFFKPQMIPNQGQPPKCGTKNAPMMYNTDITCGNGYESTPCSVTASSATTSSPPRNVLRENVNLNNVGTNVETRDRSSGRVIVLNEIVWHSEKHENREEFIELRFHPPTAFTFTLTKLVVVTANTFRLVQVINLNNMLGENGYFTVRSTGDTAIVQNAEDEDVGKFQILPSAASEPMVLMLLMKDRDPLVTLKQWRLIALKTRSVGDTQRRPSLALDKSTEETSEKSRVNVIQRTIVDGLIYGKQTNNPIHQRIQEFLHFTQNGCNYILGGQDPAEPDAGLSLNLCPPIEDTIRPYMYKYFKLGTPSPGRRNNCQDRQEFVVNTLEHVNDNSFTVGVVDEPMSALDCPNQMDEVGVLVSKIEGEIQLIKKNFAGNYESKYYPTTSFETNVFPKLKAAGFVVDASTKLDVTPYEIISRSDGDGDHNMDTRIRCKLCYQRLKTCRHNIPHVYQRTLLMKEEGISLGSDTKSIQRKLISHLTSPLHLQSIFYNIRQTRTQMMANEKQRLVVKNNLEDQAIANSIDVIYTMLRTNTAPSNANYWYQTLKKINANIGGTLYSPRTAFNIINFVSDQGTSTIFGYLMMEDKFLTITLDGSSDRQNHHYVLVYITGLEAEVTMPYFAFLLELGKSFTAEDYFEKLLAGFHRGGDEFFAYVKRRLIAVVTDSAAVMVKLHGLLNTWVDRRDDSGKQVPLIKILCLAHKLQLATRGVLLPSKDDTDLGPLNCISFLAVVEKFMQHTYAWFKVAGKRIGEFRELQQNEKQPTVQLKQLHPERWISSEYETIRSFLRNWGTTAAAAKRIADQTHGVTQAARLEANDIYITLHDKYLLITIVFLQDFTASFKVWSQALQKFDGLLMDQYVYFQSLHKQLADLEIFRGPALEDFLKSCTCSRSLIPDGGCTLDEYEASDRVTWNGLTFGNQPTAGSKLSVLGPAIISKVRAKIKHYISDGVLNDINVLSPKNLPSGTEALHTQHPRLSETAERRIYAREEIRRLSTYFGLNPDNVEIDWAILIEELMSSQEWRDRRAVIDSNQFWGTMLRSKNLPWTENTKILIRGSKLLTASSAICESGFSIFNIVKNQRRTSLQNRNLESIMRIIINGPRDIEQFDAIKYAEFWKLSKKSPLDLEEEFNAPQQCVEPLTLDPLEELAVTDDDFDEDRQAITNAAVSFVDNYLLTRHQKKSDRLRSNLM